MPIAVEYLNMQKYDVIFSSHHCVAKGIIPRPDAVHLCYCHSPARYIWDLFWTYSDLNKTNRITKLISFILSNYLRIWDVTSSSRVDYFIANSGYTASRIKKYYNRKSEILFPPVDTEKFNYEESQDYYLIAGRLVAYKRFDLAIEAFNSSGKQLVIIGDGVEFKKLRSIAGKNIKMLGKVSSAELVKYMNNCKGFIFPGKEDFGIVMAEAQAAGKPVIAYKGGGSLDIVKNNETGLLFENQNINSLNQAVDRADSIDWDHKMISGHSKKFDTKLFEQRLKYLIDNAESLALGT
jgi:glycosyltransferase involved in cell wall biosynthesis